MYRSYIVVLLPLFIIFFLFIKKIVFNKKVTVEYAIVLYFMLNVPFGYSVNLISAIGIDQLPGSLGYYLKLNVYFLLFLVSLFLYLFRGVKFGNLFFYNKHLALLILFFCISIINPFNESILSSLFGIINIAWIFLFFFIINNSFGIEIIWDAFWDGLFIMTIIQFILALCFPVFDLFFVTELFHDRVGRVTVFEDNVDRIGAAGTFDHPGKLAFYASINALTYLSFIVYNYKRRISIFLLSISISILILTVSRLGIAFFIVTSSIVLFIKWKPQINIFSLRAFVLLFFLGFGFLSLIIFFTPVGAYFVESNSLEMLDARLSHFMMALEIFKESPIIGVGFNSHLAFARANISPDVIGTGLSEGFAFSNPIHNIHLIVLAEFGFFGLLIWVFGFFNRIQRSRNNILTLALPQLKAFNLACIGILFFYFLYGMGGWAPFTEGFIANILFYISFLSYMNGEFEKYKTSKN